MVHRNLTPKNILFDARGRPRVSGFGLSAQIPGDGPSTLSSRVMESPGYLAPEQVREERDIGPATDVYALGAILYSLLTAQAPFRGSNLVETLSSVLQHDPMPPRSINRRIPRKPRDDLPEVPPETGGRPLQHGGRAGRGRRVDSCATNRSRRGGDG